MKTFTKFSVLISLFCLFLFFQGQTYKTSDDDSNVDKPVLTPQAFMNHNNGNPKPMVVTDPQGFDNFNMGVNFAESMVSENPTNPYGIFHNFNLGNVGWWTTDGYTWNPASVPFPGTAGDPWTAYDSSGNLYCININGSLSGTWIVKSLNNGQSWGGAVPGCTGNDRETMAADNTGGPYSGYIYCGMTPGNFSRSTDGGASFQFTQNMTEGLPGFMMVVAPSLSGISGGAVYVVTSTGAFQAPTYTFYMSTNGGLSFTNMSTQNGWVNVVGTISGGRNSYQNMRLRPYPFICADNSFGPNRGRMYIVYCANNPGGDGNKPSVYVRYSTDGGATFNGPIIINDDANPTTNAHFHPAPWCDKLTGKLIVHWMDTRDCPTSDSAEIFASYSSDGGLTWAANQDISTAKMRINCPTCGGGGVPAYQGDYNGACAYNGIGILSWTDFRSGNFGSYSAYYPDYALRPSPTSVSLLNNNDSAFVFVTIPAVKSYTNKVKFTASVTPTPSSGTITLSFLNKSNGTLQDSITAYPDSVRLRIRTSGSVTVQPYTLTLTSHGKSGNIDQTPVHVRTISMDIQPNGIIRNSHDIPEKFYLYQNYPNPFNPSTNIRFDIAKPGLVKLVVYDITGRQVAELVNGNYDAGKYTFNFDASNIATGVYFYKL